MDRYSFKKCFSQKGVFTVLVTLLIYKLENPNQDIRLHRREFRNGFSGRSFDTKYITPTLKKLGLPSMAESGWLTRTLERSEPYTLNYSANIEKTIKEAFLNLIDRVKTYNQNPKYILVELLKKIIKYNPARYYILSYIGIYDKEKQDIQYIINEVKQKHGCQIIINGVIPTC